MKRILVSLAACVALLAGGWLALNLAFGQTKEKEQEKAYTLTTSQLEEYVQKRVNQALAADKTATDQKTLNPENWHTAIYKGVEYTVYTGPGQVLATRWAKPAAEPKPPPPKPTESKPAEAKPAAPPPPEAKPAASPSPAEKVPAATTQSR
jgi:hypothetical protein